MAPMQHRPSELYFSLHAGPVTPDSDPGSSPAFLVLDSGVRRNDRGTDLRPRAVMLQPRLAAGWFFL